MKKNEYYLRRSLELLKKWLPSSIEEMMKYYHEHSDDYDVHEEGYVYCTFSWKEKSYERIILLVYDEDAVIADCAGVHCDYETLKKDQEFYDAMSEESDWIYLEHYILSNLAETDAMYPKCEILLYSNAYVSKRFRRRNILAEMDAIMRAFVLRSQSGNVRLASIFSMDPDIACYGEDKREEPYYYSFEADEPVRMVNCEVAKKIGYEPIRLEETEENKDSDGTKLWFCYHIENNVIFDQNDTCMYSL